MYWKVLGNKGKKKGGGHRAVDKLEKSSNVRASTKS